MKQSHLFIPERNITEADYISLSDIILLLEKIDSAELEKLKNKCINKMEYLKEHPINVEEYEQLKRIHFKNTYSSQKLWTDVFSKLSLQEYQAIPHANLQELDINFYKKYVYDVKYNKYSSSDLETRKKYEEYFYTKAYDALLELKLKQRQTNKYDYFYIGTIAKDGVIRCGVKGVISNNKTKKAIYVFTEELSNRDMYTLGEPNTIYLTPTTNVHDYSSWNTNLFIRNAIKIKSADKTKRLLWMLEKIQEILK